MLKSGYHLLDGAGIDLNNLGKVTGFKAKADTALAQGKPVFLENVKNGSNTIIPIPVALMKASTSVNIYAATGNLAVAANDTVSSLV